MGRSRKAASPSPHRAPWSGLDLRLDPVATVLASMRWMATAASFLPFVDRGLVAQECASKIAAFEGFQAGRRSLAGPPTAETLLAALADNALLSAHARLWQLEGIGYGWAELALDRHAEPRGLLKASRVGELPRSFRVALHTGLGLKLATHSILHAGGGVAATADHFSRLCRDNGRDGYEDVCFEGLGLAVRILRPALCGRMTEHLARIDPRRHALFWHGVGRGLYFLPSSLMPALGARWSGAKRALEEPVDDAGRNNALAGLGWALTLVNLRHPRVVIERWLHWTDRWGALSMGRPLGHGAAAALALWNEHAGRESLFEGFLRRGEMIAAANQRQAWQRHLVDPMNRLLSGSVAVVNPGALFTDRGVREVEPAMVSKSVEAER